MHDLANAAEELSGYAVEPHGRAVQLLVPCGDDHLVFQKANGAPHEQVLLARPDGVAGTSWQSGHDIHFSLI